MGNSTTGTWLSLRTRSNFDRTCSHRPQAQTCAIHACVHACMHACVHASVQACVHACVRACVRAHIRACVRAWVRACESGRASASICCLRVCAHTHMCMPIGGVCVCMCVGCARRPHGPSGLNNSQLYYARRYLTHMRTIYLRFRLRAVGASKPLLITAVADQ